MPGRGAPGTGSIRAEQPCGRVVLVAALLEVANRAGHRAVIGIRHQGGQGQALVRPFGDEARGQVVSAEVPSRPASAARRWMATAVVWGAYRQVNRGARTRQDSASSVILAVGSIRN